MESYDPYTWVEASISDHGAIAFARRRRALCLASAALLLAGAAGAWLTRPPHPTAGLPSQAAQAER